MILLRISYDSLIYDHCVVFYDRNDGFMLMCFPMSSESPDPIVTTGHDPAIASQQNTVCRACGDLHRQRRLPCLHAEAIFALHVF